MESTKNSTRKPFQSIPVNQQTSLQPANVNKKPSRSLKRSLLSDPKSNATVESIRKKLPPLFDSTIKEPIPTKKPLKSKIPVYIDPPLKKNIKPMLTIPNDIDVFNLFGDEPPIYKLPADCLVTVFNLLKNTSTLSVLSTVCQHWRKVAQQPFLWRDIHCSQEDINKAMIKLNNNQQFEHIRKLTIESGTSERLKHHLDIHISPFKRLEILYLNNTSLIDIEFISLWIKNATTIHCQNIPVNSNASHCMPNFSRMKKLNTLKLHFKKKCSLKSVYFHSSSSSVPSLQKLPTSLKTLELINVFDDEEDLITEQDVLAATSFILRNEQISHWQRELPPIIILDAWFKLERKLVLKYTMLSYLTNLTSLSLDRVSSFTSNVWNKCLLPCTPNLTFVSFTGWHGNRESPHSIMKRNSDNYVSDIEHALKKFISSLSSIQVLVLHDFVCSYGLIDGLNNLDKKYTIQDEQQLKIDKTLFDFKISIKL